MLFTVTARSKLPQQHVSKLFIAVGTLAMLDGKKTKRQPKSKYVVCVSHVVWVFALSDGSLCCVGCDAWAGRSV